MKRDKKFDNILNECLERLLEGETLEQCLIHYPDQAAELKPLLETALAAKRVSVIQPRAEFRARARNRLHAALQTGAEKKRFFLVALPRWTTVVAVVLVLLLAGGSTVAAASSSMPDEPLYPVKLATEQVWLAFTPSKIGKAELYTKLADRRVAEIINIASKGEPELVDRVARRLDAYLARVAILAEARATEEKAAMVPAPAPSPPANAGPGGRVYSRDEQLARLRVIVARYAVNHPAALREILRTAPESAKPALRRAIAIAEARYRQTLEAVTEEDAGH